MGRYMAAAIERVRGRKYRVQQSVGLYPTHASTDDYAYSRHIVDPRKGKIIAFTMEWGRSRASTPFHPPYAEMRKVMREVSAALLECCLRARSQTALARGRGDRVPDVPEHGRIGYDSCPRGRRTTNAEMTGRRCR